MSKPLKFPVGLEGALFVMVANSPENYTSRIVTADQVLVTWAEWVYGSLADADPNDVSGFTETVADADCWYQVEGRVTTLEWAVGEDSDILIMRLDPSGAALIAAERGRQVAAEGWSAEHDDEHADGELAQAAASYLATVADPDVWAKHHGALPAPAHDWPWDLKWWKPSVDPVRNLVKAGALIAAEIDRLMRAKASEGLPTEHTKDTENGKEGV